MVGQTCYRANLLQTWGRVAEKTRGQAISVHVIAVHVIAVHVISVHVISGRFFLGPAHR